MTLYQNKYRVESARLKNWDYRNAGAYFITICIKDRLCLFGDCRNGIMSLNEVGKIADRFWLEIPQHFTHVKLGAHIIMPNHIHGILILEKINKPNMVENRGADCRDTDVGADGVEALQPVETLQCNVSTDPTQPTDPIHPPSFPKNESMANITPKPGSISTIIRSYKSACTKHINLLQPELNFKWQGRFHDHIIRTDDDFVRITNYIIKNPKNWNEDRFYQ